MPLLFAAAQACMLGFATCVDNVVLAAETDISTARSTTAVTPST